MFFKREVMFFELPGAGGNNIFWAPRTVYFNLYAFCGASDINNFWQCLHILYECVFDSFTGTDLALAPTSILAFSLSLSLSFYYLYLYLYLYLMSISNFWIIFFPFCTKNIFQYVAFCCNVDDRIIFPEYFACYHYFYKFDKFFFLSIYFNWFVC